jgi:hypothetical protein
MFNQIKKTKKYVEISAGNLLTVDAEILGRNSERLHYDSS